VRFNNRNSRRARGPPPIYIPDSVLAAPRSVSYLEML
jgi:hypothetical protein